MTNNETSERLCPACGSRNDFGAKRCANCGADLENVATPEPSVDDDLRLRYVDPENRIEMNRFVPRPDHSH